MKVRNLPTFLKMYGGCPLSTGADAIVPCRIAEKSVNQNKDPDPVWIRVLVYGPSGATRTRGFLLPKQAPYQLGYTRVCMLRRAELIIHHSPSGCKAFLDCLHYGGETAILNTSRGPGTEGAGT